VLRNNAATGNSALGCGALLLASTGGENTALGWNAGSKHTTGTINMGNNGSGATTINIDVGGSADTVNLGRTNCSSLFSFGQQNKDEMLALFSSNSLDPNNPSDHRCYGFGVTNGGVSVPQETSVGWVIRVQIRVIRVIRVLFSLMTTAAEVKDVLVTSSYESLSPHRR